MSHFVVTRKTTNLRKKNFDLKKILSRSANGITEGDNKFSNFFKLIPPPLHKDAHFNIHCF